MEKIRKKPVRHVYGRLRNVEACDKLWTFELTKAGVRVRQRNRKATTTVTFEQLVTVMEGITVTSPGENSYTFKVTSTGLVVTHGRTSRLVEYALLKNLGRNQMELFPTT